MKNRNASALGRLGLPIMLVLIAGVGLGLTSSDQVHVYTAYAIGGFLFFLFVVRRALLGVLANRPHPTYRNPDYQRAESALMGKFQGSPRRLGPGHRTNSSTRST
jgi:hypothetical protein